MRNNETGEFELVVGDRQLLSAFFIVVLLCAVAFAMGYVVGQNAPKSGKAAAEAAPATPQANTGADARPQPLPPAPAPQSAPPAAAPDSSTPQTESAPQPTTQPSQGSEPVKPASPAPTKATTAVSSASTGLVEPEDLPTGNFWQVMAVGQQTAEMFRTTLKDHGFAVILSPAPRGLVRVLVGPYPDTQALGKAKTDLEGAGFHPMRFKP
jgi:type IV secretory pathway VirB10-like protein